MALTFDTVNNVIILDTASISATNIYKAWVDWLMLGDNLKYLPAFKSVGGDDLGSGLSVPPYYFLQNGWRIRPMESDHTLTITGNLFTDTGDDPVIPTIGNYRVLTKLVVPVLAQGISTSGSSYTLDQMSDAIWSKPVSQLSDKTTIGGYISKALLTVSKFIGLK